MRKEMETIRERTVAEIPPREIVIDLGNGKVVVRRSSNDTRNADVIVSEDPDVRAGQILPVIKEGKKEFVVMPGINRPKGHVHPEGFDPVYGYTLGADKPWSLSPIEVGHKHGPKTFIFSIRKDNPPKWPLKVVAHMMLEDTCEGCDFCRWFVVDASGELWVGDDYRIPTEKSMLRLVRIDASLGSYLSNAPDDIRVACGLPPKDEEKPEWQKVAEKQGWKPPNGA
jgi:hypothetical protein